jgi:hypothetical protein
MISSIRRPTALALALVNAAANDLTKQQGKVDHKRWVARHVRDKVENTQLGTKVELSTKVF